MLRRWDPRLDPRLRPDQWERVARRRRRGLGVAAGLLLGTVLGLAAWWSTRDLTRNMAPEAVVDAAARTLLAAPGYRFTADLTGIAKDGLFPTAVMKGEFQRSPQVIHLTGKVLSGESTVPLEYYLEGEDLYVRHPADQNWLLLRNSPLDELTSFSADSLASPLLKGLQGAKVAGRERLPAGDALVLTLDLNPNVMLPRLRSPQSDRVAYRLWVYTHTLKPARFAVDVRRPANTGSESVVTSFSYQIAWDFSGLRAVAVPDAVKRSASETGGETSGQTGGEEIKPRLLPQP